VAEKAPQPESGVLLLPHFCDDFLRSSNPRSICAGGITLLLPILFLLVQLTLLQFLIPAIWSLADTCLRFAGKQPWLAITMFLDFCSTVFVGYYVPIMISNWMWSDSNAPALAILSLIPPLSVHPALSLSYPDADPSKVLPWCHIYPHKLAVSGNFTRKE